MGAANGARGAGRGSSGDRAAGAVLRVLIGLALVLQAVGQPAGGVGTGECSCSDVQPPGTLTCAQQRDYGKCQAIWMILPPLEVGLPEGYCQSTCGRCECAGAPVFEESAPAMPEELGCKCTDIPPPETTMGCERQRDLGKCFAVWMRRVDGIPEGYCQETCGLCRCTQPGAEAGAPSVHTSSSVTVDIPALEEPASKGEETSSKVVEAPEEPASRTEAANSTVPEVAEEPTAKGEETRLKVAGAPEEPASRTEAANSTVPEVAEEPTAKGEETNSKVPEAAEEAPSTDGAAKLQEVPEEPASTRDAANATVSETAEEAAAAEASADADVPRPRGKKKKKTGKDVVVDKSDMDLDNIVVKAAPGGNAAVPSPDAAVDEEEVEPATDDDEGEEQGAAVPVELEDGEEKKPNSTAKGHGHRKKKSGGPAAKPKGKEKKAGKDVVVDKSGMVFDMVVSMKPGSNDTVPLPGAEDATAAAADAGEEDDMETRKNKFKAKQMETASRLSEGNGTQPSEPEEDPVASPNPENTVADADADGEIDKASQKHKHKAMRVKKMAKGPLAETAVAGGSPAEGNGTASSLESDLELEDILVDVEDITEGPSASLEDQASPGKAKTARRRSLLGDISWAQLSQGAFDQTGQGEDDPSDSAWAILPSVLPGGDAQVTAASGPPEFGEVAQGAASVEPGPVLEDTTTCTKMEELLNSPIGQSQFKYINKLLTKSGLLNDLKSPTLSVTLFVPLDDAFESGLPEGLTLDALLNDDSTEMVNLIRKVVLYHWVVGVYRTEDFQDGQVLRTTYGATVQTTDDETANTLQTRYKKDTDSWEVESAGGKYSARIDIANVDMCWSVIHVVNRILWPEGALSAAGFLPQSEGASTCETIVDLLDGPTSGGQLTYMKALIDRAGFQSELRNPEFKATIFAPTDDAIRNLPEPYCAGKLLADNSSRAINEIQKLLLFHVVPRPLLLEDMEDGMKVGTWASLAPGLAASGQADITFIVPKSKKKKVKIMAAETKAKIVTSDIRACGVVVHFIDNALIPTYADNTLELLTCTEEEKQMYAPEEPEVDDQDYGSDSDVWSLDPNQDRRTENEQRNPPEPVVRAASGSIETTAKPTAQAPVESQPAVDETPADESPVDDSSTPVDDSAEETSLVNFDVVG